MFRLRFGDDEDVSPAHAGVEGVLPSTVKTTSCQPRARGGPGTDVRLALCWARPAGPGCLLHEGGVVLARGGRG